MTARSAPEVELKRQPHGCPMVPLCDATCNRACARHQICAPAPCCHRRVICRPYGGGMSIRDQRGDDALEPTGPRTAIVVAAPVLVSALAASGSVVVGSLAGAHPARADFPRLPASVGGRVIMGIDLADGWPELTARPGASRTDSASASWATRAHRDDSFTGTPACCAETQHRPDRVRDFSRPQCSAPDEFRSVRSPGTCAPVRCGRRFLPDLPRPSRHPPGPSDPQQLHRLVAWLRPDDAFHQIVGWHKGLLIRNPEVRAHG